MLIAAPAGAPAPAEETTTAPAPSEFVDHEAKEPATEEAPAEPTTEETTEPTEETDAGEEDTPAEKKRESGSQRLKRKVERLEARLAEAESHRRTTPADTDEIAAQVEKLVGKPPDPNDEKYKGDYLRLERDLQVYELDKRQVTRDVNARAELTVKQQAVIRRELSEAHAERIEEFKEKATDFDKVMESAGALKAAPVVEELILDSDKSAHLVYYLAKNPSRLDALNQMTERAAAREMGRIEAQLALPEPKKATAATKPSAPLKGGAGPTSSLESMTMAQYVKFRRAQDKEE